MPEMTNDSAASALNDLLDEERDALVCGDLEQLGKLLMPKEALIEALNAMDNPDPAVVQALDSKVRRNQLLLDGAMEGIRAVSARLAQLRETRGDLETYDADGRKRDIVADTKNSVERRA